MAKQVISVRPLQYAKALSPMLVTELGIVIEVRLSQLLKAFTLMLVTELGITVVRQPQMSSFLLVQIIPLQLSLLSR